MVSLNFQSRFATAVRTGLKTQTIRAPWRDGTVPWKPGCTLHLFTGMRTKNTQRLGTGECTAVQHVTITSSAIDTGNGWISNGASLDSLARADGFDDWNALRDWFQVTHGLPFSGYLIIWRLVK